MSQSPYSPELFRISSYLSDSELDKSDKFKGLNKNYLSEVSTDNNKTCSQVAHVCGIYPQYTSAAFRMVLQHGYILVTLFF